MKAQRTVHSQWLLNLWNIQRPRSSPNTRAYMHVCTHIVYVQIFEGCNFQGFLWSTGHPRNFHPRNFIGINQRAGYLVILKNKIAKCWICDVLKIYMRRKFVHSYMVATLTHVPTCMHKFFTNITINILTNESKLWKGEKRGRSNLSFVYGCMIWW